jgi:hypothetical protein
MSSMVQGLRVPLVDEPFRRVQGSLADDRAIRHRLKGPAFRAPVWASCRSVGGIASRRRREVLTVEFEPEVE